MAIVVHKIPENQFLTPDEVSRDYRINIGHLANMRSLRKGPAFHKFGRKILYAKADLEAYIRRIDPRDAN